MIEYSDRYQALGIPEPDPSTMCTGACEGTGTVPIYCHPLDGGQWNGCAPATEETDETYRALWASAEQADPSIDGWHFVMCLDCHGTGQRAG